MKPHELAILRAGLHMTHEDLAQWLDVPVATVAEWEAGAEPIPNGIGRKFRLLCDGYFALIHSMRFVSAHDRICDSHGNLALMIYDDEESFWAAHPACKNLPACLQRAAAFAIVTEEWIKENHIIGIIDTETAIQ